MADVGARGLSFHVQRLGSPESAATVVFLHGLVMDNLSSFYFTLANPLAATCDVILYDLRGHGMSSRPASGYTLGDMVADLDALLTALDVRRPVFLVGNSFGGLLALAFAAAFPERARGVVLIDGHVGETGWADRMAATLELQGEERDRQIAVSFQSWLGRHSERKSNRLAKSATALVYSTSLIEDMKTSDALSDSELGRVRAPVLALYGETSDLRASAERMALVLPDCDLIILPGCTHSVLWEATARVREEIVTWIGRQARAPIR
jgi:pimeloyl-ACP methyl ester carboxylesterase